MTEKLQERFLCICCTINISNNYYVVHLLAENSYLKSKEKAYMSTHMADAFVKLAIF